jgi:hypothetical protein
MRPAEKRPQSGSEGEQTDKQDHRPARVASARAIRRAKRVATKRVAVKKAAAKKRRVTAPAALARTSRPTKEQANHRKKARETLRPTPARMQQLTGAPLNPAMRNRGRAASSEMGKARSRVERSGKKQTRRPGDKEPANRPRRKGKAGSRRPLMDRVTASLVQQVRKSRQTILGRQPVTAARPAPTKRVLRRLAVKCPQATRRISSMPASKLIWCLISWRIS